MKGDIRIKIVGPVGCGKSTVGQIITEALVKAGITPDLVMQEPNQFFMDEKDQKKRIKETKKNKVTIEEIAIRNY